MAKKKAAKDSQTSVNVSKSILEILTDNRTLSGKQVMEELAKKHPGAEFNQGSASVAFSNARRKLGIKKGRWKSVRMQKPVAVGRAKAARAQALDMDLLKAAKKFVSEVGNAEKAIAAVQQIAALQIGSI